MITKLPKIVWYKNIPFELSLSYENNGSVKEPNFQWKVKYINWTSILGLFKISFKSLGLKKNENKSLKELEKDILEQLKDTENENY